MRTLCVACHADVTAAQCAERCSKRKEAKKKLEILISGLSNGQNIEQNHAKLKVFCFYYIITRSRNYT